MSRMHVIVERVRDRFDRGAQRSLDERRAEAARMSERNRRASLAEAAREDLERLTAGLPESEAEIYRAELRRLLAVASDARAPAPSPRAAAEALFAKGRAAA